MSETDTKAGTAAWTIKCPACRLLVLGALGEGTLTPAPHTNRKGQPCS